MTRVSALVVPITGRIFGCCPMNSGCWGIEVENPHTSSMRFLGRRDRGDEPDLGSWHSDRGRNQDSEELQDFQAVSRGQGRPQPGFCFHSLPGSQ